MGTSTFRLILSLQPFAAIQPGATILVRSVQTAFQRHNQMLKTLILFTALLAVPAFAQKDLPEGTGKPATVRVCTGCHGAEMFSATRLGQAEWDRMIANMTTERGVAITDADYAIILKYLTTYMGPPKANFIRAPEAK